MWVALALGRRPGASYIQLWLVPACSTYKRLKYSVLLTLQIFYFQNEINQLNFRTSSRDGLKILENVSLTMR